MTDTIEWLPLGELRPHPQNPRLVKRTEVIESICTQIKSSGEFDPAHALLVRPHDSGYQIIMGHHRRDAAEMAGLDAVPCWVRCMDDEAAHMALATSNTQDSMSPLEWGMHALQRVRLASNQNDNGDGLRKYAETLGRVPSYVSMTRKAAEVADFVLSEHQHLSSGVHPSEHQHLSSGVHSSGLLDKAKHLYEISKCPKAAWIPLVDRLLREDWPVTITQRKAAPLRELDIPNTWSFLFGDFNRLIDEIIDERLSASTITAVCAICDSVDQMLAEDDEQLTAFHQWLNDQGKPFVDLRKLKAYQSDISKPTTVKAAPHVSHNSGENEWYTPVKYIEAARTVMGGIDLDPATSEIANSVVGAREFYTLNDDGLSKEWKGRVWMNPPYSTDLIGRFVEKLCQHVENGDVTEAIVLVNNGTETEWFQRMARSARTICFPDERVKFWNPRDDTKATPLQGQALIYFGHNSFKFSETFMPMGFVGDINVVF